MRGNLARLCKDERGGVVDTIVTIGIIVLIMGPVLLVLSGKINALMERIIAYVARNP
jgi:hypothetical protein